MRILRAIVATLLAASIVAPARGETPAPSPAPRSTPGPGALSLPLADPYPSTYKPFPSRPTLIRDATLLTAAGPAIAHGSIYFRDGKIVAVGPSVGAPPDA
ncbi:MAG: hypothetical protein WCE44_05275, partial [Candidatus Velthaea sp.]